MYGEKLRSLRKIEGWTQEEVAKKIGVSKQTYSHYENEKRKPSLDTIRKLCIDVYDVDIDEVFGDEVSEDIESDIKQIGETLKQVRLAKNLSIENMAESIGVTPARYTAWESNAVNPDLSSFVKIADVLGLSTDYLLGRSQETLTYNQSLLFKDVDLPIENILEKYHLTFDGAELDEEEIKELLAYIKVKRAIKKD